MSIQLPVHYTDLVHKDPDGAVCACMSRDRLETSSGDNSALITSTSIGRIGCGMRCYSPLGTEMWGRSLLVFHSFDLATVTPNPGFRILRLAQGARSCQGELEQTAESSLEQVAAGSLEQIAEGDNIQYAGRESSQNTARLPSCPGALPRDCSHDLDSNKKRKSEDPEAVLLS